MTPQRLPASVASIPGHHGYCHTLILSPRPQPPSRTVGNLPLPPRSRHPSNRTAPSPSPRPPPSARLSSTIIPSSSSISAADPVTLPTVRTSPSPPPSGPVGRLHFSSFLLPHLHDLSKPPPCLNHLRPPLFQPPAPPHPSPTAATNPVVIPASPPLPTSNPSLVNLPLPATAILPTGITHSRRPPPLALLPLRSIPKIPVNRPIFNQAISLTQFEAH